MILAHHNKDGVFAQPWGAGVGGRGWINPPEASMRSPGVGRRPENGSSDQASTSGFWD